MTLPLEVLLNITRHLNTPDYCNVRLASKYFEEQLHNAFAKEFFTKRQFMISEFSLQALIDISKSRFSSNLTHVIIGLERPSSTQLMHSPHRPPTARNRLIYGITEHSKYFFSQNSANLSTIHCTRLKTLLLPLVLHQILMSCHHSLSSSSHATDIISTILSSAQYFLHFLSNAV